MRLGPVMVDVSGLELTADDQERLQHPQVGGVILFARNFAAPLQLIQLCHSIREIRRPALLIAVDHGHFTAMQSLFQSPAGLAIPLQHILQAGALGLEFIDPGLSLSQSHFQLTAQPFAVNGAGLAGFQALLQQPGRRLGERILGLQQAPTLLFLFQLGLAQSQLLTLLGQSRFQCQDLFLRSLLLSAHLLQLSQQALPIGLGLNQCLLELPDGLARDRLLRTLGCQHLAQLVIGLQLSGQQLLQAFDRLLRPTQLLLALLPTALDGLQLVAHLAQALKPLQLVLVGLDLTRRHRRLQPVGQRLAFAALALKLAQPALGLGLRLRQLALKALQFLLQAGKLLGLGGALTQQFLQLSFDHLGLLPQRANLILAPLQLACIIGDQVLVPLHAPPGRGEGAEEHVGAGRGGPPHLQQSHLPAAGVAGDPSPQREREQLVAQADAEHRQAGRDGGTQEVAGLGQPGVAGVVVGVHRAAEHQHRVVRRQLVLGGQPLAGVGPAPLERAATGAQPLAQQRRRAVALVLHDEHHGSGHRLGGTGQARHRRSLSWCGQRTGSIRSRSNGETWMRYSSHSARLLRRKKSKTCSPRVSASNSESSAILIAS